MRGGFYLGRFAELSLYCDLGTSGKLSAYESIARWRKGVGILSAYVWHAPLRALGVF